MGFQASGHSAFQGVFSLWDSELGCVRILGASVASFRSSGRVCLSEVAALRVRGLGLMEVRWLLTARADRLYRHCDVNLCRTMM